MHAIIPRTSSPGLEGLALGWYWRTGAGPCYHVSPSTRRYLLTGQLASGSMLRETIP
jgi:hypothetical protein